MSNSSNQQQTRMNGATIDELLTYTTEELKRGDHLKAHQERIEWEAQYQLKRRGEAKAKQALKERTLREATHKRPGLSSPYLTMGW